jgi:hypothetical protein
MVGLFSHDVKIVQAVTVTAGAAGTSAINSSVIDMSGYGAVCFIVQFGAIVSGAVTSIKAQQDITSAMSTAADLAGTNQTVADTADDTVFYVDIRNPQKDFVRLVISRATQNATCSAIAVLYRSRIKPTTHGAGVAGETFVAPAEGTA